MLSSFGYLDVIIGDGCSSVCQPQALLSAAWGIPMISWGCTSPALSNKEIYPTFTRVDTTFVAFAPVLDAMLDFFGWTRIAIVTTPEDIWKLTADAVGHKMETSGKKVIVRVVKTTMKGEHIDEEHFKDLKTTLTDLKAKARIFLILAYQIQERNILIAANDLGMFNGEYVFHGLDNQGLFSHKAHYRTELDDKDLYQGLMGIETKQPSGPKFEAFMANVLTAFQDPRFADYKVPTQLSQIAQYSGNTLHQSI